MVVGGEDDVLEQTCSAEMEMEKENKRCWCERSLCAALLAAALPTGGTENKRQRARSSDTKPGHAGVMRPAQWEANTRGDLLILHPPWLIC